MITALQQMSVPVIRKKKIKVNKCLNETPFYKLFTSFSVFPKIVKLKLSKIFTRLIKQQCHEKLVFWHQMLLHQQKQFLGLSYYAYSKASHTNLVF